MAFCPASITVNVIRMSPLAGRRPCGGIFLVTEERADRLFRYLGKTPIAGSYVFAGLSCRHRSRWPAQL